MAEMALTLDDLKIASENGKCFMMAGGSPLKTSQGKVIWADNSVLFERIKADYQGVEEIIVDDGILVSPRILSAYVLASTKTDFIDKGTDYSDELSHWLSEDPFFQPTAGHPTVSMYQSEKQEKGAQLLRANHLPVNVWGRYELKERGNIVGFFLEMITSLSAGRKAALPNMAWPVGGQFVITLMYLSGKIVGKRMGISDRIHH